MSGGKISMSYFEKSLQKVSFRIRPVNDACLPKIGEKKLPLSACDCDNYHSCHCDHDECNTDVNVCGVDFDGSGFIDTEVEICAALGWG